MRNFVKEKLRRKEVSIGTWITIGHPDISEITAGLGFEWLLFDTEHGPLSIETVQTMMQAMNYTKDCLPLVRVAWNDMVLIKRALDIGAYGLIIPWVNSREEAENAVSYCKYPPEGVRGCGPRRAALHDPEYIETANEEILIVVQIETETALKNLDDILTVDGIDACFVGPADLSMSLGIFGQWDSPRYTKALEKVLETSEKYGVAPGIPCSEEDINLRLEQGFKLCSLESDLYFLERGAKSALDKIRGKG